MILFDILLCVLILPFTPFIYIYNYFYDRRLPFVCSSKSAFDICIGILQSNSTEHGIIASPNEYTDVWTRDAFFSLMGLCHVGLGYVSETTILALSKFQRKDGLIPLYIGSGDACAKLICRVKAQGKVKAVYGDSKTGDVVTDSCFQYIILAGKCKASEKAWNYMQQYVKNGLIYEQGLGSWMDTINHDGHVMYTNMLYFKAAETLGYSTGSIKRKIYEKLWNGKFFKCSTTIESFDQVGNALAIKWLGVTQAQKDSIINYRKKYFTKGLVNPPCWPLVGNVYLPCYMIGNQRYHNFGWSWVNLLFISIMDDPNELALFTQEIRERGTVYEIYDEMGPVNQLFCVSQPEFSEAAGMYLMCQNKKASFFYTNEKKKYDESNEQNELYKWLGFIFTAMSGILQAIRSLVINDGTLSFWAQVSVIVGALFQILFFALNGNWQFILIQIGIIVLSSINIYDIGINRPDYFFDL